MTQSLGTAFGKVRIDYESTGVGRATKDVEALQTSLVRADKEMAAIGSAAASSTAQVSKFAAQTAKVGKNIKNPAEGLGNQVSKEVSTANKAIADFQKNLEKSLSVGAAVKITPTDVRMDMAGFNRAIEAWKNTAQETITINRRVKIVAKDVEVDGSALNGAIERWKENGAEGLSVESGMKVRLNFYTDVSQIRSIHSQIQNFFSSNPISVSGSGSGSGGSGGSSAGAAGGAAIAGRAAVGVGMAGAAAATAAIAGVGWVLAQGFSRLQGLDTAATKLKAIGYETQQIEEISKNALGAVKGTAFGLDQAFDTAANAISAGIKPGQELTDYLKLVADNASIAQISMQEMGEIFNQVAINGKLTGDVVDSLQIRGVDVFGNLAKSMGISVSAAQKLENVTFEQFRAAMNLNAGAAVTMGGTISGSFENLLASVKRIGANILKPIFGDANGEASQVANAIQSVTDQLEKVEDWMADNQDLLVTIWERAGKGIIMFGQVGITALGWILEGVGKLIEGIGHIPSAFAGIFDALGMDDVAASLRGASDNMTNWGTATFEAGQTVFGFRRTLDGAWESITNWANESRAATSATGGLGNALGAATPKAVTLGEALEKYGLKDNQIIAGIEGTTEEFKELIKTLSEKGAPESLINYIKQIRAGFENGGRQVKNFASAMDKLKDSTASASDKADTLIDAMKELGLLPGGDELHEYQETMNELTDASREFASAIDTVGPALLNLDGTISATSGNGRKLFDEISQMQKAAIQLAASGEVASGDVYDQTATRMQALLAQYGIQGADAQKVIEKYLTPREQFVTTMAADTKGVIEQAFGNDPAQLQSALEVLTTQDDILKQLLPQGVLPIPAEVVVQDGKAVPQGPKVVEPPKPPANQPGTPLTPGNLLPELQKPGSPTNPVMPEFVPKPESYGPGGQRGAVGIALPDNAFGSIDEVKEILKTQQDLNNVLGPMIQAAELQGQNYAEAFAEGINSGNEEVRKAIEELARLSEGLGNSPAPWGPLSGKGWTKERGKVFTKSFAEGILSEAETARGAVASMAGGAAMPFGESLESVVKDMQELSGVGKAFLDIGNQIADIAFGAFGLANDLSGGRLFPKNYVKDPNAKGGNLVAPWNPQQQTGPGLFGQRPQTTSGSGSPARPMPKGGDEVAQEFINQAQAAGWNQEQILAGLGTLSQETAFGTNPMTNTRQNQNGTPGIQGVFQQDDSYLKYGDKTDPRNAIRGFIDQFMSRGAGLDNPNPWAQALKVQVPATVAGGGYDDKTGDYLKGQQRATALEVYNRLVGGGGSGIVPAVPTATTNAFVPQRPNGPAPDGKTWDYSLGTWIDAPGTKPASDQNHGAEVAVPQGNIPQVQGTNQALSLLAKVAKDQFGLDLTSGLRSNAMTASGRSYHLTGEAGDFAIPGVNVNTDNKARFATFLKDNFAEYLSELIYSDPNAPGVNLNNGKPFEYGAKTNSEHENHVHAAIKDGMSDAFISALTGGNYAMPTELPASTNQTLQAIASNTGTNLSTPAGIQDLAKSNPLLAQTLSGAPKDQADAISRLQNLDSLIADANMQGNKEQADYLSRQRSSIMSSQGLTEGQSSLDQAQSLVSGASGIASSAFQVFDGVLESIGSAKAIGDTLIRGIANTSDVNSVIEEIQTFIELGSRISELTSNITGFAAQLVGAGAASDPSGSTAGVAAGLGAASTISGLVGQGFQTVNAVIDLTQEITRIAGKYIGRGITSMLGFPGASDMKFLLDTVTGQLQAYTSENPENKRTFDTLGRKWGSSNYVDQRQAPQNTFYIYQGPGQDPRDTMSQAMFAVKSSGSGAFGYAE